MAVERFYADRSLGRFDAFARAPFFAGDVIFRRIVAAPVTVEITPRPAVEWHQSGIAGHRVVDQSPQRILQETASQRITRYLHGTDDQSDVPRDQIVVVDVDPVFADPKCEERVGGVDGVVRKGRGTVHAADADCGRHRGTGVDRIAAGRSRGAAAKVDAGAVTAGHVDLVVGDGRLPRAVEDRQAGAVAEKR